MGDSVRLVSEISKKNTKQLFTHPNNVESNLLFITLFVVSTDGIQESRFRCYTFSCCATTESSCIKRTRVKGKHLAKIKVNSIVAISLDSISIFTSTRRVCISHSFQLKHRRWARNRKCMQFWFDEDECGHSVKLASNDVRRAHSAHHHQFVQCSWNEVESIEERRKTF